MKEDAVLISVITIVKNNEDLLPRAIRSVLEQVFTDFEYIIINDGSTDNTRDVIDRVAKTDERLKAVHLPDCLGRSMARNTGLDTAVGQYILFLDADDYIPDYALRELYTVATNYNADIVYGRTRCFDSKTGDWIPRHYTDEIVNRERHNICLDDYLSLVNNHQIVGRLYRHDFLKNHNIRFSTIRKNGEDILFSFYTAFFAENISTVPSKKVYFYSLGNYIDTANESKLRDARDNVLETINFAVKYGSVTLQSAMWKKGVAFSSDLSRAIKVYQGRDLDLISYILSLRELVAGADQDVASTLSRYQSEFLQALSKSEALKAYQLWSGHTHILPAQRSPAQTSPAAAVKGATNVSGCIRLIAARIIYRVQMTPLWPLLAPLRWVVRMLRNKQHEAKYKIATTSSYINSDKYKGIKVSVIIPVYNVEEFLRQCLSSVVSQSLEDIEIICVNDCSPDNAQLILDEYAAENNRFILLKHRENQGLAAARNTGLEAANGEYIFFLDSDDYLAREDALNLLYSAACDDGVDEVIGGVLKWHEHTGEKYLDWHKNYLKREVHGAHLSNLPQLRCNVVAWNKLIKKSLLDQYSIRFNKELRKHEDNPFSCMVHVLANKVSIIPVTTYMYRQARSDSIMNQTKKEDAYYRNAYCSDIFRFIESDEGHHKYRDMYYPMYMRQLIQGAAILSQFSPSDDEKRELMMMWADTLGVVSGDVTGVPGNLKEIVQLIKENEFEDAWNKSLLI